MQVICRNPKSFKLTEGNVYTVILEKESSYTIINDNNSSQDYSKALFNEFEIPTPVPPPPPPPRRVSEEDILNIITFENDTFAIDFRIDDYVFTDVIDRIVLQGSAISCGIPQLAGLNNLMNNITRIVENLILSDRITIIDAYVFKSNMFRKCMQLIIESLLNSSGILICSTNTNNEHFELQNSVISNLSGVVSCTHLNSNSSNHIIIWNIPYDNA